LRRTILKTQQVQIDTTVELYSLEYLE
jgi:hypothetical protein